MVLGGRDISVRRGEREFFIGSEFTEGGKEGKRNLSLQKEKGEGGRAWGFW